MTGIKIEQFIEAFSAELKEENAAIFAGAGLSVPAGFVNWKTLLAPIVSELGLDAEREEDLVGLAQYHCNENNQNRSQLTKLLIDEFARDAAITENHRLMARLPITVYWTTNYDKLIETALIEAGKRPDVKYTIPHLAQTKSKRDAVVYKMHGDIDHPDKAVITKDDYERYQTDFGPFVSALSGDLVEKTFLFVGFSFTDPNLDYILSRVRISFQQNQRRHYCLMRRVKKAANEDEEDFRLRERKQELLINDLKRFNIITIQLDEYEQITEILTSIERRISRNSIFVSGAAHLYDPFGDEEAEALISRLSAQLVQAKLRIVSGFGLGVGSAIISGALEQIYMNEKRSLHDEIVMCPFPQSTGGDVALPELWEEYRQNIISYAGVAIFLFGNKISDGEVVESNGMIREFEIAEAKGLAVVPVGGTGWAAQTLWNTVMNNWEKFYPDSSKDFHEAFSKLGEQSIGLEALFDATMEVIRLLQK